MASAPRHPQIQTVKLSGAGARIRAHATAPPGQLSLQLKKQAVRSLGITTALSLLNEGAFTLTPTAPLVENRAVLDFYGPEVVAGQGWAEFGSNAPQSSLDVMFLNITDTRRFLLDLAVISLGGTITFSARPVLDRSGSGETATILPGSNHVLLAVEVTTANTGVEIACDGAYQFYSCEITPLPDG